jgi:hypothetical protein
MNSINSSIQLITDYVIHIRKRQHEFLSVLYKIFFITPVTGIITEPNAIDPK